MPSLQNTASEAQSSPGRLYSFVVLALATVVTCISLVALLANTNGNGPAQHSETLTAPVAQQLDLKQNVDEHTEASVPTTLSNQQLLYFLVGAVIVGLVGVIPSRSAKTVEPQEVVDAKALAAAAGLPLIGSVFVKAIPEPLMAKPKSGNWLASLVFLGEMILCLGVVIAIFGCFAGEGISSVFVHNPFEAYAMSVGQLVQSIAGLFGSTPAAKA